MDCQHRQLRENGGIFSRSFHCDHCGHQMQVGDTHEITNWRDTKLECGIGHRVSGRSRTIMTVRSNEGSQFLSEQHQQYDPDRCVVCGLYINKELTLAQSQ